MSKSEWRLAALGAATIVLHAANSLLQRSLSGAGSPASRGGLELRFAAYAAVTVLLFAACLAVLDLSRRGALSTRRSRAIALLVPVVVSLALVSGIPSISQDVFSYMAQGILGIEPGDNPLIQAATVARQTSIGPELAAYGWTTDAGITPYGIVWTRIEIWIMRLADSDIPRALLLIKVLVVASSLGTAAVIWSLLGRLHPSQQLTGTLAYLWNPLMIVEFAGEGHNDALMILFVLGALLACTLGRRTGSMVLQLLAVLTKYVPLLFLPAQLVFLWRSRRGTMRFAAEVAAAAVVTTCIAAILYSSLWAGAHSFDGLVRRGEPLSSATVFGGVNWILRRSPLAALNGPLTLALVVLPVVAFVVWTSLRVTDCASLARAFASIALAYVLVASPDYWPWYACMPVALLIAAQGERLLWLALMMSFLARLVAPLDLLRERGLIPMQLAKGGITGLGVTLPLLALLIWLYRERAPHTRRTAVA